MGDGRLRELIAHGGSIYTRPVCCSSWFHPQCNLFLSSSINWRLLTTLLFDERKMLYQTFLTLGLFRLFFCRTCDQAVLFLFGSLQNGDTDGRKLELEGRWRLHRKWWTAIWFSRPHFNQRELCACHGFPVHFLNISFHFLNISGINTKKWGGISDHCTAPGSWITSRWDRDQHYCKGIRDPVVQQNNKDHKILKWP